VSRIFDTHKFSVLALIMLLAFLPGCPKSAYAFELDKVTHALASGGVFTVAFLSVNAPISKKEKPDFLLPILITVGVFTAKEFLDREFSLTDMAANGVGLLGAAITFRLTF